MHPQVEVLFAWRGERQEPLVDDERLQPLERRRAVSGRIVVATDGRLNAVVVGASVDGRGFDQESLEATYRRHQLDTLFGERLTIRTRKRDRSPMWRIDWTSEISDAGRVRAATSISAGTSSAAALAARAVATIRISACARSAAGPTASCRRSASSAIGGIGSVHGYDFKQEVGDSMALLNLEYALGWRSGLKLFGFFDVGRASPLGRRRRQTRRG